MARKRCVMCGKIFNPVIPGARSMTCSEECHTNMKALLIKHHGAYKKCVDHNGVAHRVPTEEIIEHGIHESDLAKYPLWFDKPKEGET